MKKRGEQGMNIIEFTEKYGTEEKCRAYLFEMRWREGFI